VSDAPLGFLRDLFRLPPDRPDRRSALQVFGDQLARAWAAAAGELAKHSRVGHYRLGELTVVVDGPVVLHELVNFRRAELLERLRQRLPGLPLDRLRFVLDQQKTPLAPFSGPGPGRRLRRFP
jgi:hypothetical protein